MKHVAFLIVMLGLLMAGCSEQTPPTDRADVEPGTPDAQEAEERTEEGV